MGALDVSAVTMDCVHLNVDMCGEMNATTAHDIISVTAEECPDLNNVNTGVESIQQWKANLFLDKIVLGTKRGEILDPRSTQDTGFDERV